MLKTPITTKTGNVKKMNYFKLDEESGLSEANKEKLKERSRQYGYSTISEPWITLYQGGMSMYEIGDFFNVSYNTVRRALLKWGIKSRRSGARTRTAEGLDHSTMSFKELDEGTRFVKHDEWLGRAKELGYSYISEAIIKLLGEGFSVKDVAGKTGISEKSVRDKAKAWGVKMRPRGGRRETVTPYRKDVVDDDLHAMSLTEIAKELGVTPEYVRQTLKKAIVKFKKNWLRMYGTPTFELTDLEHYLHGIEHERGRKK